ncbi:MAG: pyridoxal-phosphate dependent enzyme [Planctomycetota bacterium]|nr:pyridoxal-phosphate dependent enzyme [Planctomycetota bacterium]
MTEISKPRLAPIYGNVLEMIGNTPILELTRLDTGPCRLFVKMESMNPGNSIKDRNAVSMIEAAERSGALKPGGLIIEATAGNTGLALALVGSQKGYEVMVVVPDKMSHEKISHLRAMGAEVVMSRSDVTKEHPDYYQNVAARLVESKPDAFYINQFANDANPDAHYTTTGPEIWEQMGGRIDAFVAGVGSGGTVTGVGKYLKEQDPSVTMVLADPAGSILEPLVNDGREVEAGSWIVEGIGEDFVPDILDIDLVDVAYRIEDGEALLTARELLQKEGVLAGSSVGTLLAAALRFCREQTEPKTVVTLICDHGAKYLSKMFNDHWMIDNGFIDRPKYGNIRDLISRRHLDGEDYTLSPSEPLAQAVRRMRMYAVSQMAVLDAEGRVQGIIDESDVLLAMTQHQADPQTPVSEHMSSRLETVAPDATLEDVLGILKKDMVAIVSDPDQFYGLITRIDVINYLRQQLP